MKKYVSFIICISLILALSTAMLFPAAAADTPNIARYGKTTIENEDVKYLYELFEVEFAKASPPEKIDLSESSRSISSDELSLALKLFLSDYPECFYVSSAFSYTSRGENVVEMMPEYSFTGTDLTEARAELEASISSMMQGLPNTNNYDKALYLHDRLAERVTYEFVGEHQTVYGALVAGKAVCAGYAAAYQLLLQRAGIVAWTVTGESLNPATGMMEGHAWNMVMIEDGVCVYTDVTWDDTGDELYHYYFNISKSEIDIDHVTDYTVYTLPDCTHEHHSYFDVSGKVVGDSTTAEELAGMFKLPKNGQREAIVCYNGNDINAFFGRITSTNDLFVALSCGPGSINIGYSALGNELHIVVTANFEGMETEAETDLPTEAPTDSEIKTEAVIETATEAESRTEEASDTKSENESEAGSQEETDSETVSETETEEGSETERSTEVETETYAESETESETHEMTETELSTDEEPTELATSGEGSESETMAINRPDETERQTEEGNVDISIPICKMSTGGAIGVFAAAMAAVGMMRKKE